MANLIDNTYFNGRINLAQLGDTTVGSIVTGYITRYENTFLTKALGYSFMTLMLANKTDERFEALISGAEYTINNVVSKWEGFTNTGKVSPIANYVYYQYLADSAERNGGVGTVQNKTVNATPVSPINKMVIAWDDMREQLKHLFGYLYANQDLYPEFDIKQTDKFEPQNIYF